MVTAPIDFEARFAKALDNLDAFMTKVDKRTKKGSDGLRFMEVAAKAFVAAFSVSKIIDGLQAVTGAASEAEESTLRLGLSLRATGDASSNNIRLFQDMAKELQRTSRYEDDAILANVALAKQFGVTNREAEELIRTAIDLSAVTGDDLTTTVRALGQTLDGTAGKMANQFPILQQMTKEQLRQGEAVRVLGAQYRGAAAQGVGTYAGQMNQLSKAFGDLLENIGMVIIRNPEFINSLKSMTSFLIAMADWVDRNSTRFAKMTATLKPVGRLLYDLFTVNSKALDNYLNRNNELAEGVDLFGGKLDNLTKRFNPITRQYEALAGAADQAGRSFETSGKAFDYVAGRFANSFDEGRVKFDRFANEARQKFEDLAKSLEDVGRTELDTLSNLYNRNRQLLERAQNSNFATREKQTELLGKLELKFARESGELRKKQLQELEAQAREIFENPFRALQNRPGDQLSGAERAGAAGLGAARNLLRGEEGARDTLGAGAAAVASIWLGPLGAIVGELIKELSRGKEFARTMIAEFVDAMPDLIANIFEAIAESVVVLDEKLPAILERVIVNTLPRIMAAIGRYFLQITFPFLRKGFFDAWGQFLKNMVGGVGKFISELVKGAGRFITELVKGIQKALSKAGGGMFGGGGGNGFFGLPGLSGGGEGRGPVTGIKGSPFKVGAKAGSDAPAAPLQVNLVIGHKVIATTIQDLSKLGFSLS